MENHKAAVSITISRGVAMRRRIYHVMPRGRHKHVVCILMLCFGLVFGNAHAQSPGLYKDGKKVLSFEEAVLPQKNTPGARFAERAFGGIPEKPISAQKEYIQLAIACRDIVQPMLTNPYAAEISGVELDQLMALENSLRRAHETLLERLGQIETALENSRQGTGKLDRLREIRDKYRTHGERLLNLMARIRELHGIGDETGVRNTLVELKNLLQDVEFKNPSPPLISQPTIAPLDPKKPRLVSEANPSATHNVRYPTTSGLSPAYDPADMAETIDVQFTDKIVALAAQLDHSPAKIYEYVRNKLTFECYLGSRRGSGQTLEHMKGNDYDQASLLIALLRVSGIPARYATGRVRMSSERANNWLGFEDTYTAAVMLNTAGFDVDIYGTLDNITAIACNRVWVEAWIPFINYRGAVNDNTGFMWVPLDPAFKQYKYEPSIYLYGEINFNAQAFVEDYYSTLRVEPPIEVFKQLMLDSLASYHPGATYEDMIPRRSVIEETDGIIPGTLPYEMLSFNGTFSEIPANMRYQVRFHVYGSGTDLDYTTSLPGLASKQITLSYVGATAADQQAIDNAGGIWFLPDPWLVDLKPVLKIDGCEVARGVGSIMTGTYHSSVMQFTPPAGAPIQGTTVQNYILAGNYQGLGIDPEDAIPTLFGIVETMCGEEYMGEVVHQAVLTYLNNVDVADDGLAAMMHIVLTNDVSEAIVENTITVWTDFWGYPIDLEWTGMLVDADRKIVGPYSAYGDDLLCDFMRIGGADGSIQENRVFETKFEEEAISTIKILALANDLGIPVCEITSSLGDCPGIEEYQYDDVITAIINALAAGHHVIIPRQPFSYYEWTGTAWIDIDPNTCAAGYIIYGGHDWASSAGGTTVQKWTVSYKGLQCLNPSGSITVDPPGDFYCANDSHRWTFTVNDLKYIGKDANGTPCQQLYVKDSKDFVVTDYTIKELANASGFGPGEYVFRVGGPSVCPGCSPKEKTVTIVKVDIVDPAENDVQLNGEEVSFDGELEPAGLSGISYAWSVLQGTCDPVTATTEDFQTTLKSEGTIMVKLAVTVGGTTCEKIRTFKAVLPEVTRVNFQGVVCDLKSHVDGTTVSSNSVAEWVRPFDQDDVITSNDAAYKRNASGTDDATCKIKCQAINALTHSTSVQVKSDGDPENLYSKGAYFNDWTGEINMDSGSPLRESIYQYVNNFDYAWYYRVEKLAGGWGEWVGMKRSPTHHNISVVQNAISSQQYQWVVMNSCKLASGVLSTATDKEIIDQIYKNLPELRASDDHIITSDDWAYANRLKYGIFGVFSTVEILQNKGGMCGGWFQFFHDLAGVQGILTSKRAYSLQGNAGANPEVKWFSILIDNPGLNQPQVTFTPDDFKDVNAQKYPLPLYLGENSPADDVTYRSGIRRYKFNSPLDGHALNFFEWDGKNYLYDASFGPYTDEGIKENVYASLPLGEKNGAANNVFRAKYFNAAVPHLYGKIWFRYVADTQMNGGIGLADIVITVDATVGAGSSGWLRIENEIIAYTGKTATTLTGCSRGQYGTAAAAHADNTPARFIKTEDGEAPLQNFSVMTADVEAEGLNLKWERY